MTPSRLFFLFFFLSDKLGGGWEKGMGGVRGAAADVRWQWDVFVGGRRKENNVLKKGDSVNECLGSWAAPGKEAAFQNVFFAPAKSPDFA